MKHFLRSVAEKLLLFRARAVLRRVDTVIGVTGSVGKTTTRMAITHILAKDFAVQTSSKNFNTPMGLMLSILNIDHTGSSPLTWFAVVLRAYFTKLPSPQILILEYGIDAPGDMDELLKIAVPDILVVTPISLVHMAKGQFATLEENRAEEWKLVKRVPQVLLNGFDSETLPIFITQKSPMQQLQIFGTRASGDVTVVYTGTGEKGVTFLVNGDSFCVPVFGAFQVQVFTPAIILAKQLGISIERIREQLADFEPPAGRGRIFEGKNDSLLWDFSYNSSPLAARETLRTLQDITWAKRRIAVLGTMNELGDLTLQEHEHLGEYAAHFADRIIFVGQYGEDFARGVAGKKPLQLFKKAAEAGEYLQKILQSGDFVLVKGSQDGVFLETALTMLLADSHDESRLCRRDAEWKTKRNPES